MSSTTPGGARPTAGPDETTPAVDDAWSHRPELIHYARRMLGGQGDLAEDVVQEAYLRLHEQAVACSPVAEARPWLFRVTRNLAIDERRRSQRGDVIRTSLEVVASRPRGPLEVLQGREEARQALTGLDALPPRERRAVILDQAGLPPRAIARRMQTTTNAVHQSLFRARRRMRDARAAAWGLLPLPIIRLMLRAASAPSLDRLPAVAPGSGGRLAGGAGLVGLAVAAVVGGVVADQPVVPHPAHERSAAAPAVTGPAPGTTPVGEQASVVRPAPPPVTARRSTVAVLGRPSRARGGAREAPESEDGPESEGSDPVERADREVEDRSEPPSYEGGSDDAGVRREESDGESHESRPAESRPSQPSSGSADGPGEDHQAPEAREPEAREPEAPETD